MIIKPWKEEIKPELSSFICKTIENRDPDDETFFVVDIDEIIRKHDEWVKELPRIRPFYAVKCNPESMILQVLAALGTGFDCASKAEMKAVADITNRPEDIIYANPCKSEPSLRYAVKLGITRMTFDNETELHKIARLASQAELVIRIAVDDSNALCKMSAKYGARLSDVPHLLTLAIKLKLNVIGVSFHVGSPCLNPNGYSQAIADASKVFDTAAQLGIKMNFLDIGGGFPNYKPPFKVSFREMAAAIRQALDKYFSDQSDLTIIAEPGRFYCASAYNLVTSIIGKRTDRTENSIQTMYYISNGLFGSFLFLRFEDQDIIPIPVYSTDNPVSPEKRTINKTIFWGPTCDGYDVVLKNVDYPDLETNEWLVFTYLGAYSLAIQTNFNGFGFPSFKYYMSDQAYQRLCQTKNWNRTQELNCSNGH